MNDLTGFKRDVLRGLAVIGPCKGLAVADYLETADGYLDVNHSRLYTNLIDLQGRGLIHSEKVDGRTNAYSLTPRGKREVAAAAETWRVAATVLDEEGDL